ncbi:unnamed protein product [Schistocephalus solidus]|uniref:Uncharacterized protein n=1 Tax=Schistocephalus solidus TaxID=70667 RepID=A0A183SAH5_SCHSO|nr:unnamed protein product [Schistocephalus solidus]
MKSLDAEAAALLRTMNCCSPEFPEINLNETKVTKQAELADVINFRDLLLNCVRSLRLNKLHLPQHGVDTEDFGPLQDFHVQDRVLPSQLPYSVKAADREVIKLPALVRVDSPGLRSVQEGRQVDGLIHFQFGVHVNTVASPHGGLQPADGLIGFGDLVKGAVVREEQVMDCGRRHARWGLHTPTVEKMPVSSVGAADTTVLITLGVHQRSREHGTEQGGGQYAALLHFIGYCKCFGYRPMFGDVRHHPVVKLVPHVREPFRTAEFLHDFPHSIAIYRVKGFCQIHEGSVEVPPHRLVFSTLAGGVNNVGCSAVTSQATLAFRDQPLL